jgi:hypothetical protein
MSTIVPHPNSNYDAAEIERGLIAMAMESGNTGRARKLLKEEGALERMPNATTLHRWTETYRDRYKEIRAEVLPQIKARLADVHTDLANNLAELEQEAADLLKTNLKKLAARDQINLVRNAAIAGAVHVDKAQLLRGDATSIVKRELPEVVRALAAKGIVIEGTATEVTDAPDPPAIAAPKSDTPTAD